MILHMASSFRTTKSSLEDDRYLIYFFLLPPNMHTHAHFWIHIHSTLFARSENVIHWERTRHSLPQSAIVSQHPFYECISMQTYLYGLFALSGACFLQKSTHLTQNAQNAHAQRVWGKWGVSKISHLEVTTYLTCAYIISFLEPSILTKTVGLIMRCIWDIQWGIQWGINRLNSLLLRHFTKNEWGICEKQ